MIRSLPLATMLLIAACQQSADTTSSGPTRAYDGIAATETVQFTGTEPFWGGEATGGRLRYSTPETPDGTTIAVQRFAGLNGISFSGTLDGGGFDLTVTPGTCSDGMSDRSYPFTATLRIGSETREGCAWTAARPFTGDETP